MERHTEKSEKSKHGKSQTKHIPKDAQVIMSILKELGINDYEPRVINQLLEFTYRYVTCILDDAKVYANHAKKKIIDLDDVKLASQMVLDKTFTSPPPRDVLLELARGKNIAPLPLVKPHCGLRLPPDRYCLIAANYKLRANSPKKQTKPSILDNRPIKIQGKIFGNNTTASTGSTSTTTININSNNNTMLTSGIKRPVTTTVVGSSSGGIKPVIVPKPVFKFAKAGNNSNGGNTTITNNSSSGGTIIAKTKISTDGIKMDIDESPVNSAKRKREEDDFEIVI